MSIMVFSLVLALVFSLGLSLTLWLRVQRPLENWGLAWLLGMGWGTIAWFLTYLLWGERFTLVSLLSVLVASNLVTWSGIWMWQRPMWLLLRSWLIKVPMAVRAVRRQLHQDPVVGLGVVILAVIVGFVFIQDLFWPVTDWDALALYDFRAKVMVITGSLAQGKELGYFFQYPLFTSALHAATYLSGLGVAKIWYALLYQASLAVFYALLRRRSSAVVSMWGTVFLATSPLLFQHSFMAYTNLSYTMLGSLGFMYLWQWWADGQDQDGTLGAMLVGLSTWVRISEPFNLVAALLVLCVLAKRAWTRQLSWQRWLHVACLLGLIVFTRYPWDMLIKQTYGQNLATPINSLSLVQTWSPSAFAGRVVEVVRYLWKNSAPVYLRYALVAGLLVVIDLRHRRWQLVFAWFSILALMGMIFVGTLLLSFSLESWNRIGDSVARMSMFLVPLWMYVIFASPTWQLPRKRPQS